MTSVPPPPRPHGHSSRSSDEENASVGFGAIALAHAGLSIPLLLQPREVAEFMLGNAALPTNIEQDHVFGLLASTLLAGAGAAWALKGAADRHELDQPIHERLQLGLVGMACTALGVHILHGNDLTKQGLGAGAGAAALTLAVPAARALSSERGRRRLASRIGSFFDSAARLFDFRRGFKLSTALYAALTPLLFGAGVAYVAAPQWTLQHVMGYVLKGKDTTFIWRNVGGALLSALPAMTYSLKEKADSDELAEPTPRLLNIGLLLASAGHLAVLGPTLNDGTGGRYLPAVVGTWALAAAAALVGLSSSATEKRV